ncbi:twin-arginine translocation signal domain-containing protein [Natronococcus sp. A-GB1]|uniref:twin-arginine translocation signal domain-containing protein n=1 Tax=Natronococcus sp. A-GB1 TaxID=3037648 RepID=UPI00241C6A6E|nr:twin-arginine translocation signal domain-containing protein [Natronococcus sp. A-GB1]MDG5761811.1 twin-arginine translocation signal domain-containing protein [Natronococcus sp. A-GB1]
MDRRTVLKTSGAVAAAVLVAGCPAETEDSDEPDEDDEPPEDAAVEETEEEPAGFEDSLADHVDEDETGADVVQIDYDELEEPTDVYRVWSGDPTVFSFVDNHVFEGQTALQCDIPRGENNGSNAAFWFPANGYGQPLDVRQRAMVRLSENWTMEAGDVCRFWCLGLNTEAGTQGSGSRGTPSGTDGWSSMLAITNRESRSSDEYKLAAYTYHMDQLWVSGEFELTDAQVPTGEWFALETEVAMNSIEDGEAVHDGEVRCWIDGALAYERTDFRWTTIEEQAVEYAGPLVRYGGGETAPTDLSVHYDGHELLAEGIPEIPPYDQHPYFEDPANMDAYDGRVTYANGDERAAYRLHVDGHVVHTDWSNADGHQATYNATVEITPAEESESGYATAEATAEPETVDGYLFDGEVVALEADPPPDEVWVGGDEVDPDDYSDEPSDA